MKNLLVILVSCLVSASAMAAGACRGKACRYALFEKDAEGCLTIRNLGHDDIQVTVYTAGAGPVTVRVMAGFTEKVYKISRTCVQAFDYVRADAEFDVGVFPPPPVR
jgi:hypothetical protein